MSVSIFMIKQAENKATAALAINYTDAIVNAKVVAGSAYLGTKSSTDIGGMCVDQSGNLYIADVTQHIIVKVTEAGKVTKVAGSAGVSGNNGTLTVTAENARFDTPRGLACDKSGNIYVADSSNHQIRVIRGGYVSTLAGAGNGDSGFISGAAHTARFNQPYDVAVLPDGNVVVCDKGNHAVRKIVGGKVWTVAGGSTGNGYSILANSTGVVFASPEALDVDRNGNIWVADTGNDLVKKIDQRGFIYKMAGSTDGKSLGTTALTTQFKSLKGIAVDPSGNIWVVDRNNAAGGRVMRFTQHSQQVGVVADFNGSASYDAGLLALAISPAGKVFVATDAT